MERKKSQNSCGDLHSAALHSALTGYSEVLFSIRLPVSDRRDKTQRLISQESPDKVTVHASAPGGLNWPCSLGEMIVFLSNYY